MKWFVEGNAWKFGDDFDSDMIVLTKYITQYDPKKLARHCMESVNPDFPVKVKSGDIIVAGKNFGCGHVHLQSIIGLKASGIAAVVAESIARNFFRAAIDLGLPVLTCQGISYKVDQGDRLRVHLKTGIIRNLSTRELTKAVPLPSFLLERLEAGGLVAHLKKACKKKRRDLSL